MNIVLQQNDVKAVKQIVNLLKRSIVELCGPDYGNDRLIIEKWLDNKTEENITQWIKSNSNFSVTAFLDEKLVGFGLAHLKGEILLLYVLPDYTTKGIGKLLYSSLEGELIRNKVSRVFAYSTITAKTFYTKMGFKQFDRVIKVGQYDGEYPLEKIISEQNFSKTQ